MNANMAKRIADLLQAKNGGNQSELARYVGVSPQAVQQWIADETSPRGKNLVKVAEFLGVSPSELQYGDKATEAATPGHETSAVTAIPGVVAKSYPESVEIPLLDVVGSMGPGALLPEQGEIVERMTVSGAWLRRNVSATSPSNLALITAYGDSMAGTFSDGDLLLVDQGIRDIKIDAVYVLALNDELYIKRLQRRPDGSVLMISDNKKYEPYLIQNGERDKFQVLGRVVLAWNAQKM